MAKRFDVRCERGGEYTEHEHPRGAYVLATDYDALLSVLRQCVGEAEQLVTLEEDHDAQGTEWFDWWDATLARLKSALAAAAPYLERKEGNDGTR
jgi:hypothetical protein